jgi:hypothetical protein
MAKRDGSPTKSEITRQEDAQFTAFLQERGEDIQEKFLATRNRSVVAAAAREQHFLDKLSVALTSLEGKYQVGAGYKAPKKHVQPELALNVNLSDLHYGAALDVREVPLAYTHIEESRRTAAVALWIAQHRTLADRQKMKLVLNILGDVIQNQLHDLRDGDPLTEQFAAAVHLLTQLIVFVAASGYQEVLVNFTPGNHGRNTARHHGRATNQKWDAIETMIYYAISKAVAHIPNVKVNLPYKPFVTYKVFGHNIFATHGDTVIKPGYPGTTINVADVRKQVNEINAKLTHDDRYKVFIVGHVHTASKTKLPNGVYFLSNGCLIPTDAYAQSIGIMDTATCQTAFESTPAHAVGFHCEIDVNEAHDKDKSLDRIINPFKSLSLP